MAKSKTGQQENTGIIRPPIVVVMGHIDHGKTKILDWYRKTKVVEQESGGITQHIGAYSITHHGKKITFIDTPGHEAFSKLRSRGAHVADIAVLVVAADDGVKPQTKEAIDIIQSHELPFVVALNKIDKPEANIERVKQQLAEAGVLVESYGGKIPSVEMSAKVGTKMDELLEVLLLLADIEHLEAHAGALGEGVVIEAHRDSRRGNTATLIVLDGTLVKGSILMLGRFVEVIKILEDFRGVSIETAYPSDPLVVAGLAETPSAGDSWYQCATRREAEEKIAALPVRDEVVRARHAPEQSGKPVFNIILKADVVGSKEALEESLKKMESEYLALNMLRSEVGDINEWDVKMAQATKLVTIIGFKVHIDPAVRELARSAHLRIVTGDIIYEILDTVKQVMEDMLPPETKRIESGKLKVLKVFKKEGARQIIGGRVEEGLIKKGAVCEIKRLKEILGRGVVTELQHDKVPCDTVEKGQECGMRVESKIPIEAGDVLEVFYEEVIKRRL